MERRGREEAEERGRGRTEGVGAVTGLDVGEDAEGDEHGDDHGGVAHAARLLPGPRLLHRRRWIWRARSRGKKLTGGSSGGRGVLKQGKRPSASMMVTPRRAPQPEREKGRSWWWVGGAPAGWMARQPLRQDRAATYGRAREVKARRPRVQWRGPSERTNPPAPLRPSPSARHGAPRIAMLMRVRHAESTLLGFAFTGTRPGWAGQLAAGVTTHRDRWVRSLTRACREMARPSVVSMMPPAGRVLVAGRRRATTCIMRTAHAWRNKAAGGGEGESVPACARTPARGCSTSALACKCRDPQFQRIVGSVRLNSLPYFRGVFSSTVSRYRPGDVPFFPS